MQQNQQSEQSSPDQTDQGNGCPSRDTTHETHLYTAFNRRMDVLPSAPAAHHTRLDISKRKQRDPHNADTVVQRHNDLADDKVWDQRDKAADEVTDGEGYRRDPRLVAVRLRLLMVEGDEEFLETVGGCVEGGVDLRDGVVGDAVDGEDVVDDGGGFGGGGRDQFFGFADGGFVGFAGSFVSIYCLFDGARYGWWRGTYASLFAPTYPPNPMEMAPAVSSASPPRTTTFVSPRADRPALNANGTVRPSDRPRMASETMRGLIRDRVLPVLEDSDTGEDGRKVQ